MKNILLAAGAIAVFAFGSCKKEDKAPNNSARVMFVNGCAGAEKISASSNGNTIQSATNITFLGNSGYQYVSAGANDISFKLSDLGTPLKSGSTNYTAAASYTVFAGGIVTNPSIVFATDDMTAPTNGNAKIRFVNLSIDALNESASANTTTFAAGINAQSFSSFTELPSGSYTLKAGDPTDISTVVTLAPQQLSSGKFYTLMLTGTRQGTGISALKLTLLNN